MDETIELATLRPAQPNPVALASASEPADGATAEGDQALASGEAEEKPTVLAEAGGGEE